jgi:hypothetical protein
VIQVLDRRRGNPISLAVVYLAVAARLGVELTGTNMPQRFLLQLRLDGTATEPTSQRVFIDVAERGALLSEQDCRNRLQELAHQPGYPSPHLWTQVRRLSLSPLAHVLQPVAGASCAALPTLFLSALWPRSLVPLPCAFRPALTTAPTAAGAAQVMKPMTPHAVWLRVLTNLLQAARSRGDLCRANYWLGVISDIPRSSEP